jgi:hypothetical protein
MDIIKPIRTKADYPAALKEIETLMMAKADSPEEIDPMCSRRWWKRTSGRTSRWTYPTLWMPSSSGWSNRD